MQVLKYSCIIYGNQKWKVFKKRVKGMCYNPWGEISSTHFMSMFKCEPLGLEQGQWESSKYFRTFCKHPDKCYPNSCSTLRIKVMDWMVNRSIVMGSEHYMCLVLCDKKKKDFLWFETSYKNLGKKLSKGPQFCCHRLIMPILEEKTILVAWIERGWQQSLWYWLALQSKLNFIY